MAIFDPTHFFSLAQSLLSSTDTEASHRTIIGRVYYSCHLIARDRMYGIDGIGLTNSERKRLASLARHKGQKVGGHLAVVIAVLYRSGHTTPAKAKRLADQLSELKEMREEADYHCDSGGTATVNVFAKHNVGNWLDLAKAAMALGSNLLPELRRL